MADVSRSVPSYRLHKASQQAVVTLAGRDHYLGPFKSAASRREYDRLISEWLAAGRPSRLASHDLTIVELCLAYWRHAKSYYQINGLPSGELHPIKSMIQNLF